jgi:probable blue pigment (indigoidine) exporter
VAARTTALTALAPATWGTTYFVATEFLPPGRPLLTATLRALPVGLLALAFSRSLPQGSWWWRSGVLGALNIGVFFALLFVAVYRLPGGLAATLAATVPLFVVALSWPLLGQRPTVLSVTAGTVGLAGVALLVLSAGARFDAIGAAAALGAAASLALGIVLHKRWGRPAGLLAFTAWQLVAGGLLLAPLALAVEGAPPDFDAQAVGGFVYLGLIGTALAYALWFRGIDRLPTTRVSVLDLLSPLVAVVVGVALASEAFGVPEAIGTALVLSAVLLGQRPQPERPAAPMSSFCPPLDQGSSLVSTTSQSLPFHARVHPASPNTMRILGIVGSVRRESHNRKLLRAAEQLLPRGAVLEWYDGLKAIPPYDQDDDVEPSPAPVRELRDAFATADAVLIASPEYNSSIPGVLKNALDWASRPYPDNALRGKPVAVVGGSPGTLGAAWAQAELRKVLSTIGARVIDGELPVPSVHEAFDSDSRLVAPEHRDGLTEIVDRLLAEAWAQRRELAA